VILPTLSATALPLTSSCCIIMGGIRGHYLSMLNTVDQYGSVIMVTILLVAWVLWACGDKWGNPRT